MAYENSTKYTKNLYWSFETSYKMLKRREYSQRILWSPPSCWSQNQRYHQKIKFQANISDDYIHENCQNKNKSANQIQHTKKIIHHDYPRFTRMSQHVHINVIYHIKKQKSKPTCYLNIVTILPLPLQSGYILFMFLVWYMWLGLSILCWIEEVSVGILGLFHILAWRFSTFHYWVLYWLWVCHKWLLLCWDMFPLYPLW